MSEHENNIDNNDIVEELPQIEAPIKTKKPVSPERYEQLKQARLKEQKRKKK